MSETLFTKVDYDLSSLTKYIELGEIALPDIQRPFVWKNSKIRDLFDSMYRGYPVGNLLFWQSGHQSDRTIGTEKKQKPPRLVIVDGQQRLTSLYAVVKGIPVLRDNYETEKICIAFNPIEEKFEVTDAAIRRDKTYIPDISCIWNSRTNLFRLVADYLNGLRKSREVSDIEEETIQRAISKLQSLSSFPFTALELASDISEENVSDVFVRINSKGKSLNQSDFILTLMSVFWDEGRTQLEKFCRDSRVPSKDAPSPFNHFIDPSPDQLLRVSVGVAFKRARLQYVYSILRGKDLETGLFSDERRIANFEALKKAQDQTLNIQYWHDFLNCIRMAGFLSQKMISSNNNLMFSYMLYLIGRNEYGVDEFELRKVIAQWFFMSAVTGRFTGSPESTMESDLARFREATKAEEFVDSLRHICEITLNNDFWNVTLPNGLATSATKSPSLLAYNAALVLLDAPVLFSNAKVSDLLNPAIRSNRSSIERHHLFPKNHLAKLKISGIRATNQIANYAFVEWLDNMKILDHSPVDYVPKLKSRFNETDICKMYYYNSLPKNWEQMEYRTFLERRREMMAQIIREGYHKLTNPKSHTPTFSEFDILKIINDGESEAVEFKSTLRVNLHTDQPDKRMELSVLKTIAGFLNTNGGTLIVGVSDDGCPIGVETDKFPNEDKMNLHLVNIVKTRIGMQALTEVHAHFEDYNDDRVFVIKCSKAKSPSFVKDGEFERFYVRTGPSTSELSPSQAQTYIKHRFNL